MARKAHVKRIFPLDQDGNPDTSSSIWIDVLRIDDTKFSIRGADDGTTRVFRHVYKWHDEDSEGADANKRRQVHPIAVFNQADPPSDNPQPGDDQTVTLNLVERFTQTFRGHDSGKTNLETRLVFKNANKDGGGAPIDTTRKITVLRVPHNDLGNPAQGFLDALTTGQIDWTKDYLPALQAGSVDDSQYIDEEFINKFHQHRRGAEDGTTRDMVSVMADNIEVENQFSPPDTTSETPNKLPFRTDPLQMIVNVSFTPEGPFVAADFGSFPVILDDILNVSCHPPPGSGAGWPTLGICQVSIDGPLMNGGITIYYSADGNSWTFPTRISKFGAGPGGLGGTPGNGGFLTALNAGRDKTFILTGYYTTHTVVAGFDTIQRINFCFASSGGKVWEEINPGGLFAAIIQNNTSLGTTYPNPDGVVWFNEPLNLWFVIPSTYAPGDTITSQSDDAFTWTTSTHEIGETLPDTITQLYPSNSGGGNYGNSPILNKRIGVETNSDQTIKTSAPNFDINDDTTWQTITLPDPPNDFDAYGDGPSWRADSVAWNKAGGGTFVVAGQCLGGSTPLPAFWVSQDGINWTATSSGMNAGLMFGAVINYPFNAIKTLVSAAFLGTENP